MNKIKINNKMPYFCTANAYNSKKYKKIYEYFLILDKKGYSFTRKNDLKNFLYEKITDRTYKNKNEIDEQQISCIVTNRSVVNDVVHAHVYDLFNITSFWDNY